MTTPLEPAPEPIEEPIVALVQGDTVVVHPAADGPERLAWLLAFEWREMKSHLERAERDLRTKRGQITRLQEDQDAKARLARKSHPQRWVIELAFEKWRQISGRKGCKLTDERFDMTAKRLTEDYEPAHVVMGAAGIAANPHVIEDEAKNDYDTAMQSGGQLERYVKRCPKELRQEIAAEVKSLEDRTDQMALDTNEGGDSEEASAPPL